MSNRDDVVEVAIYKDPSLGYGFSIMGGDPVEGDEKIMTAILVSKLKPGAPAEKTGLVSPGQEVLGINGVDVVGANHDEAVGHLRKADGLVMLKLKVLNRRTTTDVVLAQLGYEVVKCRFPFTAQNDDELSLVKDEIIFVKGKGNDGWCFGQSEKSGKKGMFPGQFVIKLSVGSEILGQIAQELENLVPGISHRMESGVMYEELDVVSTTDDPATKKKSLKVRSENLYERLQDGDAASPINSGNEDTDDVYPMAMNRPSEIVPSVVLVGKEVLSQAAITRNASSVFSKDSVETTKEHIYAPINSGRTGELIYEPTPFEQNKLGGENADVEDLYSSVNKVLGDDATPKQIDIIDDMYATLQSVVPPSVPKRQYDKSKLLPPTMRIHVQSTHDAGGQRDEPYERLPGQKEFDLDDEDGPPRRTYDKMDLHAVTPEGTTPVPGSSLSPPPLPIRRSSAEVIDSSHPKAMANLKKIQREELRQLKQAQKQRKQEEKQRKQEEKQKRKEEKAVEKAKKKMAKAEKKKTGKKSDIRVDVNPAEGEAHDGNPKKSDNSDLIDQL